MAHALLQGLQKFRFLIVAALVFAFLSTPFITEAGSKQSSVSVVEAGDTLAGLSSDIVLQGSKYQNLEVSLKKPDGSVLSLETVTNGQGEATLTVSEYHLRMAGLYQVAARQSDKDESYGKSKSFEVYAGTVSESNSSAELSKKSAALGETVELDVSLMDAYDNPIDGHVLKVLASSSSVSVYSPEYATDEEGHQTFYLTSSKKGVYDFSIFDSSINKTLSAQPKLAFSGSSDIGGSDVQLAAASGEVDGFIVDGLDDSTVVGDAQSVTIKAVDEDGFTVSDYTGTVRFSSSDDSATLPNDYTFLADDQGEHTFSLAVKFVTPGEQTLEVTDIEEFNLRGEATTEVTTDENSGVDYGSDFESDDFERDGDFTLISPASGSYSSETLEVQGEAEYGYTAVIYMDEEEMGRVEVDFDNSFTYTLEDLKDGTYELYVDIVELGDGDPGEEEIVAVVETSDSEKITIDTTAPELVSITSDPEDNLAAGDTVTLTVLSEKELEEASVVFEEEVYTLEETSTSGKYQVDLVLPEEEGEYTVDIILMDSLGNEVEHRDQLTLKVGAAEEVVVEEPVEPETVGVGTVTGLTVSSAPETILLSWEAAESELTLAFYRVYYGPSADALYAVSETYDSSTNWSILDLTGEERYYFAVAAVDVEGNEGELSEVAMGIPEASRVAPDTDAVDDTSEVPAITGSEDNIQETPESGPAQTALFILSALGGAAYLGMRKRAAVVKSF